MTKTSQQLKNMIEDWIKLVPITFQDSTEMVKSKDPNLEWQFLVGTALHITRMSNRQDRIFIHWSMSFADEIKEKFLINDKFSSDLAHSINGFLVSLDLSFNWVTEKESIAGLDIRTYIDVEEIDRPLFFKTWDKIVNVGGHIGNTIKRRLNPQSTEIAKSSNTSNMNMYH